MTNLKSRAQREALLASFVRERAATVFGVPLDAIDPDRPLTALGLDSLSAAELRAAIEDAFGVAPPLADLLEGIGVRTLAVRLLTALEAAAAEAGGESSAVRESQAPAPLPAGRDAPLSAGQQALWFHERLAPAAGVYNLAVAARVRGPLDTAALRRALALLAERHPALRTVFPLPPASDDGPVQRVLDRPEIDFREEDTAGWSESRLAAKMVEEAWLSFDLAERPPFRVRLYRHAGRGRALLFIVHHLIADFGSLAVIARELGALYRQELGELDRQEPGGSSAGLAPPGLTPSEHARRQAAMLAGPRGERLWAYWRAELSGGGERGTGGLADLDLPTDRPRPPLQTYRGGARAAELPAALASDLRALASSRGATLFMALLAAFQALLARLSGQEDFAVGSPAAGRAARELAGSVGYFVNPVALRARLAGDPSFSDLLGRVQRTVLAGLEHGDFPFPLVAERLRPARDPTRPPIFQVLFLLQRARLGDDPRLAELSLGEGGIRFALGGPGGLQLESIRLPERRAPFDLTLRLAEPGAGSGGIGESDRGLAAALEFNADLFDPATAGRLLGHLRELLAGAIANPGLSLSRLPLLSEPERRQLLVEWSAGADLPPASQSEACLHELVAAQAARTPGAVALVDGGVRLTYAELDRRSDRLARHLAALGVGPESRVGLCLRRSAEMVVAMLAVLKAGGAYVPLDPAYPPGRLELMLEDSGARVVLADANAPLPRSRDEGAPVFVDPVDELVLIAARDGGAPPSTVQPGNLAYLIYTSGSTGRPKAVAIEHRSAVALVRWAGGAFTAAELAGMVASTSISFDLSVFEIFVPLAHGGAVLLAENALEIPRLPAAGEATLVNTVPSALAELMGSGGLPPSVRTVNLAGEPVPAPLVEAVHRPGVERLYNLYGPSEDTTYSTWGRLAPDDAVTIGRPVDGTRAYVLDRRGEPVPAGVPGELLLGGAGLARGYLGRPDLTAERFAPDPFGPPGGRLYRTGDLVRWRPDGRLEFLGRLDHQVKIRGFRVELGEIEAALARHPALREAAVVAVGDGDSRRLVAYVSAALPASLPEAADLRSHLAAQLPSYMVPAAFTVLDALPLSTNGKVDRKALARLAAGAPGERATGLPGPPGARTPVESAVAGAMAEVLGRDDVGVHDDFFDLGGHSLLATRLAARISRLLGADLPLSAVFRTPTVAGLAAAVAGATGQVEPIRRAARAAGEAAPLSFAQERLWFLDRLEPGAAVYVLPGAVDLAGDLAVPALAAALAGVVRRHETLRSAFRATAAGPVQVTMPPSAAVPIRTPPSLAVQVAAALPVVDLRALPAAARTSAADRLAREEARRPFDLARGPLCRFVLLRLEATEHRLLANLHHIVADGWSLALLLYELAVLYEAAVAGARAALPELPVQYADYAAWQRSWLQGEVLARELSYWRRLAGLRVVDVPADHPRPPVRSSRGATRSVELTGELGGSVAALARQQGATLFMALLATVQALLARWTGADAVAVGSPVANRGRAETEGLLGLFVNTLVLDVRAGDDPPFRELLARTREACLGAYAHQDLPFERLVEELQPRRDPSRNPLFQVLFVLEEPPRPRRAGGLAWEPRRVDNGTAKFDLTFSLEPRPRAGWRAAIESAAALFEPATIERLLGHWRALLAGVAAAPEARLSALPMLAPAERHQLVHEWNDGIEGGEVGGVAYVLGRFGELVPAGVPGDVYRAVEGAGGALFDPAGRSLRRTGERARRRGDGRLELLARSDGTEAPRRVAGREAGAEPHDWTIRPAVREMEERLARIWREVLGVERVGIHDDFFALGGHSLLAARAAFRVAETFGVDVPVGVLFQARTVAALANWLEGVLEEALAGAAVGAAAAPGSTADPRPAPRPSLRPSRAAGTPPRTPDEERLAAIWSEVLGVAPIGVDDDFLTLGGHSLLAYRIASLVAARLGVALPASSVFEAPTVAALARRLAASPAAGPLAPVSVQESYPLSLAQQRLWVLDRLEPGSPVYNLWLALRLAGRLEARHLAASLAGVLARHEPLRTVYAEVDGRPVQVVLPPPSESPLRLLDLAGLPAAARAAALRESARAEVERPFDLERGPIARFLLVRLAEEEHVLVATVHHIAADGWSMEVLCRDLAALYGAALAGRPSPLPPLPLRYVDHAVRQREALSADLLAAQLADWRRELAELPALELPADRPRPPVASRRGATRRCDLPAELAARLAALGRGEGLTLFVSLLGGFVALLSRWTGQEDFAVGAPAAGRHRPETEQMVGFFVNTLVLRARLADDPGFLDLLRRLHGTVLASQPRQDVPFERLVEELQGERVPGSSRPVQAGSSPLVQTMLAFWGAPPAPPAMPGLAVELADVETTTAKFDLTLSLLGGEGGLAGWLEYRTELFDAPTAARFAGQLRVLLAGAAADPGRRLSELPLLSAGERWQLLGEWNDTAVPQPLDRTLHGLVEAQIARSPDAVAIDASGAALTYRALGRAADRLARRLRRLGVGPEVPVGLAVERSPEMVVGMLGICQAGGAVLPIDPESPGERQAYLLAAAGAPVLLTRGPWPRDPPEGTRVLPLAPAEEAAGPGGSPAGDPSGARAAADNLACVLFTSGSTGLPKGVALPHRGLVHRLLWAQELYRLTADDAVLQKSPLSFDFSIWECFGPLLAGARLVLARPGGHRDMEYLAQAIVDHGITVGHFIPSLLELFLRQEGIERCVSLRWFFCGGEALSPGLRDRFFSRLGIPLENQYGPTEISIDTTRWVCAPGQEPHRVPIGRPIGNARIHLLDRRLREVPPGVVGELLVGGPGVARGYAGRPDLTAERFVPDPYGEGERLYRTGDLARRLHDGTLEYRGRADDQVKVRGVRIEPREVEAALLRHPAVAAAAVAPDPQDASRLVAWWVARPDVPPEVQAEPSAAELRDALRRFLPEAMVPGAFVRLAALPLTPNGKLDRRALPAPPAPAGGEPRASRPGDPPGNPIVELLAGLWSEVLKVERVGPDDGFFDLGGHSLLAVQLLSRVRAACGIELPLGALFDAPTPAALARRVADQLRSGEESGAAPPPLVREGATEAPLSFGQQRLWFLHRLDPESDAYHVPGVLRLAGELRTEVLERAIEEIVRRHEVLRTVFSAAGTTPVQVVLPAGRQLLPIVDLSALPDPCRTAEARRLVAQEARRPFDLAGEMPLRTLLLRLEEGEHRLAVVMHHIASDAWSLGILLGELAAHSSAFAAGEPSPLAPLPVQYADFARWQRRWLAGEALEREVAHWRGVLAGAPESLALPYDRPAGAATAPGPAGRRPFALAPQVAEGLAALARRSGWTLFMALLAGFQALLSRLCQQEDVVVGAPIANRNHLELEGLIGFFTNTLALRVDLSGDPPFQELGRRARAAALAAYAHQELPFEKLVEELAPERNLGRNPLFQVMLVVQKAPAAPPLPGLAAELLEADAGAAKFDLVLSLVEDGLGLTGVLEHDRHLFEAATADRMLGHLGTFLTAAVADPGRRLSELPLLTAAEQAELAAWSRPLRPDPPAICVHELVAERARQSPDTVAVSFGPERLTYGELVGRSRRLARRLAALGVGPDVPVGLFLARSTDQMVALLGVLAAGGAYLPLDPAYPAERLRLMLEDAAAPVVLTHGPLAGQVPPGAAAVVRVDEDGPEPTETTGPGGLGLPETLLYVIYTSGSTGRPKGVAMTHGALSALLAWQLRSSTAPAGRTLQFTSLSFDVSFQEIFATWCAGGELVLVEEEVRRDPAALLGLLAEQRVERLFLPFVALQQLATTAAAPQAALPAALREVLSAGEQLHVTPQVAALLERLPGAVLQNHYGPSETHAATWLALAGAPAAWPERVPIGRPLDHARVFLLDAGLAPVPLGVAGEVYVGGPGLARGYLARPDLTAARFVPDPFDRIEGWRPGARLYRTGDLARRRSDGELEYLGRIDGQVKIRGHRLELAEVEAALARHPAVLQAAATVRGDAAGARRLAASVVFRPGAPVPDFRELKDFLAASLPDPMVPSAWARLDAFPLTPSGKLDRRALAANIPEEGWSGGGVAVQVAPRTPAEELLAGIWSQVLGVEAPGAGDDFFALGGHSLLITQVASRIREVFAVDLSLRRLFEAPTLAAQAAAIAAAVEEARGESPMAPPVRRGPRPSRLPLSFAQERLWFLDRLQPGGTAYNVPLALRAVGQLNVGRLAAALAEVVRRHEVLRTVFAERDGEPAQVVLPAGHDGRLPVVDLLSLRESAREREARRLAAEEAARPFDLARGPLLRTLLLELAPDERLLLLCLHHIVADGWSLGVLVREVQALYGLAAGAGAPLPELPVQYADFALWQRQWLAGEVLERQLAYWRERLAGAPAALELPADRPRPPVLSMRGAEHRFALSGDLARRIGALGLREGVTPFMVLAAGLFSLLSRLSGQRDLAIGSPIANRNRLEAEGLIGFFVNTLVLRTEVGRGDSFRNLLRRVREVGLGAYAHQDVPFEKLVDELQPDRDLSRSPLFQVALALQNAPLPRTELPGLALEPVDLPAAVAKFDLAFVFIEETDTGREGGLDGALQYATDLFDAPTAARLAGHLETHLSRLVDRPGGLLAEAGLLSAPERQQVLREWNDTRSAAAPERLLHQLFEERADRQSEGLAALWQGEELTYRGLEERANRLANLLREAGVGRGGPRGIPSVGIWMERSLDLPAAMLGVLKSGASYLPLDPAWPPERVETILAASEVRLLVTSSALLPAIEEMRWRLPLVDVVCLDVAEAEPPPESLDEESVRALWDFVADRATDRATAGGFVSSFTGQPFAEAEVDEYRDRVLALAEPWLRLARPGARVLEVGCGSGLLLWEMAPRVARCVGLDPSPRTQEENRERARSAGLANVELVTGFAHELDTLFAGESEGFDLVVMASTVQFFPGPRYLERVVAQALRLLAPGGALLIADVPDLRRREELRRALAEAGATGASLVRRELWLDEDLFGDLAALPDVGQVEVLHRRQGFANELRFRYDVRITRGEGAAAPAPRRRRLWTGWHAAQCPAARPPAAAGPDDVAYVIHTSGSTGVPKGIAVQHRPAVHLVRWVNETFGVGAGDRLLFVTSPCFDLSVYDVFGVLAAGAALHVAPEAALRDPERLARTLRAEPITVWDSAPAALQQLVPALSTPPDEEGTAPGGALRLALLSGDWIPVRLPDEVRTLFPSARVVSLGGATEATVWSNWYPVEEVDPRWPSIPYGRPIAGARYHVLDEDLEPCPIGTPGDLYIGGGCLCVGYARRPELTAASFLPDPFAPDGPEGEPGARLYRTGDRARSFRDGNLEFLGRRDQQVKVRGYRIELGEIEAALVHHPGVREGVAAVREDVPGDRRLVAYVVPAAPDPGAAPGSSDPSDLSVAPSTADLRAFLLERLPEYMVPWSFVTLAALPATPNGKLDRAALPAPEDLPADRGRGVYVAPRNDLERAIGAVWHEVLGRERVGVRESFFEVGGSSLLMARLHSRLRQALGRDVPFVELFRHPTIEGLAQSLRGAPDLAPGEQGNVEPVAASTAEARVRTDTRREAMRRLQQTRGGSRGQRRER